jgi:putative oxidoreductase
MILRNLVYTRNDHALAFVRLVLGIVFFAHGAQKMLGCFGGQGFERTMATFTGFMGIPTVFALVAILAEFLGGIGLLIGLLTRIAAFGIAVNMIVAIFKVHARNGLFMNWTGTQHGEGIEFHLLVIAIAVLIMAHGAGAWSVDRALSREPPAS